MNPLRQLEQHGQAVWLDNFSRGLVRSGELARLVTEDGLTGITSNPSIFAHAMSEAGSDYDEFSAAAGAAAARGVGPLYEQLAVEDIQAAADILRPVHERTCGRDGFVSIEVSPYLAMDAEQSIVEARRLWREIDRANLMVKIPATEPGLRAIEELTAEGLNVNITLLFSQQVYERVVDAFMTGLERLAAAGGDLARIASVASFFVSRIDSAVDKLLDARLQDGGSHNESAALLGLKGKVAIANAKLAYRRYLRRFADDRWSVLRRKGAHTQRLLWASTGTKNSAYSDVLYVEELVGRDTVNTMPPATLQAFRQHGEVRASLEQDVAAAEQTLLRLQEAEISLTEVTARLVDDGVQQFAQAADRLLAAVARRRSRYLGSRLNRQRFSLPAEIDRRLQDAVDAWRKQGKVRRLWAKDATLWTGADESQWLGWLDIVGRQRESLPRLREAAEHAHQQGFSSAVLLGMGGSSLGAEVLAESMPREGTAPSLIVLDSTDPAQIRSVESRIDLARTLFIVSSKSGSTLEPDILRLYFFDRVAQTVGAEGAGAHFIAITDADSPLEAVARRDRYACVHHGVASIGGRYSVLSDFGMVPASLLGLDLERFLAAADLMVQSCAADVPPAENPGVTLGLLIGTLALAGRDKLTIFASEGLAAFGAWLEQLLAESTGKQGKGVIPVDLEPLTAPEHYGNDRIFVYLRLDEGADDEQDAAIARLEQTGQPVVRIEIADAARLGQEFFRWEFATAVAGAAMAINPFDQPDVEAAKAKARQLTSRYEREGRLPPEAPFFEAGGLQLYADPHNRAALEQGAATRTFEGFLRAHLARLRPGDYLALLAFCERNGAHQQALQRIRALIHERKNVATCVGFGPRFLHSTGQAYKGGPASGVFLQITADPVSDLAVPGRRYGFGIVETAQARGDLEVLAERGRRVLRVHLGKDVAGGLASLARLIERALP